MSVKRSEQLKNASAVSAGKVSTGSTPLTSSDAVPGTSFEQILELTNSNCTLTLLVIDAIERFEVAMRVSECAHLRFREHPRPRNIDNPVVHLTAMDPFGHIVIDKLVRNTAETKPSEYSFGRYVEGPSSADI